MDETQRFRLFVAIDVSNETFEASCINTKEERLFSLSTSMSRRGVEELTQSAFFPIYAPRAFPDGHHGVNYHANLYSSRLFKGFRHGYQPLAHF